MQIPRDNSNHSKLKFLRRPFNTQNARPIPKPSNPVVKGKITNSLGWINNNKKTDC